MLCFTLLWTKLRIFSITSIYRSRNSRNLQTALWECNQQKNLEWWYIVSRSLCKPRVILFISKQQNKSMIYTATTDHFTKTRTFDKPRSNLSASNSSFLGHKLTLLKDTNMFILCGNSRANSEVNILKSSTDDNHITDNLKLMGRLGRNTAFPPWITLCNELKNFRARIKHKTISAKPDLFLTCKDDCQKVKEPQNRHP